MPEQNFKNHTRLITSFHFVLLTVLLAVIIGSVINLAHHYDDEGLYSAALLCVISIVLPVIALFARSFALKAQDRAIRAEENFRHFLATGKPHDGRLRMSQIIALRFAGDAEFVALAKKAADENLDSKQIKTAITNWRADHHRV